MANQKNVEALTALLKDWMSGAEVAAESLASQGVLVPSVLTAEDIDRAIREGTTDWGNTLLEREFRAALEAVAKGE